MDNKYRYERKFVFSYYEQNYIDAFLKFHPLKFKPIFSERKINNIYFDTINLKHYFDNIDGLSDRRKLRLRWYNNFSKKIKNSRLEIKIKRGHVGTKKVYSVGNVDSNKLLQFAYFTNLLKKNNVNVEIVQDFLTLQPALVNSYKRKYYLSNDGSYRVTVDRDMEYFRFDNFINEEKGFISDKLVLEIKYSEKHDVNYRKIKNSIAQRLSRNSKYVNGINFLAIK